MDNKQIHKYTNYNYLPAGSTVKKKCAYCGKEYEHNPAHIEYKTKANKTFCSYTCYKRYCREHEQSNNIY